MLFEDPIKKNIRALYRSSRDLSNKKFSLNQIIDLPLPVQNYFKHTLKDGQPYVKHAKLSHTGNFRQNENQKWSVINGEEHFVTDQPGFVWVGRIKLFPMVWITGLDCFINGHGKFELKIGSILTINGATKGKELDESELMRWIGESPLFPTSLLPSNYLRWYTLTHNSARAVVNSLEISAELVFYFDNEGRIISMEGERFRAMNDTYTKQKWRGYYSNYAKKDNMIIPLDLEASWISQKGNFSYAKFRIKEIKYNYTSDVTK